MAGLKLRMALDVYKDLSQHPDLLSARIAMGPRDSIVIQSYWSQRNLDLSRKQKFAQNFNFDQNLQLLGQNFPIDTSTELLSTCSQDNTLKAILREVTIFGKTKQMIEIWDLQHLWRSYDVSAFELHGDVYYDPTFSSFHLSRSKTRLVYIAEKKLRQSEPYYKQKPVSKKNDSKEEKPLKGTEYLFKPDWGEQLMGKHRSIVVILNLIKNTIVPIESLPAEYFPGEVIWGPSGSDMVGVIYRRHARYPGQKYCTNRESYIFYHNGLHFRKITRKYQSCRSPRFSPDGRYLVWLERDITPAHHHVHRLVLLRWEQVETTTQPEILIDTVATSLTIANNKQFYGLYNFELPIRCWSDDSKYVFFSTPQRSDVRSYVVNIETKSIVEIENPIDSSLIILDVYKDYIAFKRSSLIMVPQLVIGKFNSNSYNIGNCNLTSATEPIYITKDDTLMFQTQFFSYNNEYIVNDFNFTYLGRNHSSPGKLAPLLVIPHGGPHTTFSNEYTFSHALFARLGFAVLLINYRGSIGMGGESIDFIMGKIGKADILDCVTAISETLKKYEWLNPDKVVLFGGSYGGFLCAHLSGQYPDLFKAVALRNPVIDIPTLYNTSDIPDWCSGESGCATVAAFPEHVPSDLYPDMIREMEIRSPRVYGANVKAPTLIALGTDDLRVPPSQGKLWFYILRANNVKARVFTYDDNHSLTKGEVEIDHLVNVALWFMEHICT